MDPLPLRTSAVSQRPLEARVCARAAEGAARLNKEFQRDRPAHRNGSVLHRLAAERARFAEQPDDDAYGSR